MAAGAQISKHEANVEAAIKNFAAVITVINYPENHWVTLQFDPKRKLLEVFDSLAPKRSERQLEKLGKVSPIIVNHIF
jgi:Ulp1 family protease